VNICGMRIDPDERRGIKTMAVAMEKRRLRKYLGRGNNGIT
jgi:hypothetical protein